jgi:hypothetical protein
MNFTLT